MTNSHHCAALFAITFTPWVAAQPDWSIAATTGPSARSDHALAYDGFRDVVVLFGGVDASGARRDDTWEFDGTTWTRRLPRTSPPPRGDHAMVFDVFARRVLLFGGDGGTTNLNDTWEWDGVDWVQLAPTTVPAPRRAHAMTYDLFFSRGFMFGGDDAGALGDTWFWDSAARDWVQVFPRTSPSPRAGSAVAPLSSAAILLYGGEGIADTWLFDALNWRQVFPSLCPGPRAHHTLTPDWIRDRAVLFGDGADTWEWQSFGSDWIPRTPSASPGTRTRHAAVHDAVRTRLVLFGGSAASGETWTYQNPNNGTHEVYGFGCAGTNGVPALAAGSARPWIGETFRTGVNNLASGPATMLVGFAPGATPLDAIGMIGCALFVAAPPITIPLVPTSPTAAPLELSIRNDPTLVGLDFFYQAFCSDPNANNFGATVSEGGHGRIGVR